MLFSPLAAEVLVALITLVYERLLFYGDTFFLFLFFLSVAAEAKMHFGKSKDNSLWVYRHVCLKSLILGSERQRVILSYSTCHKNNPSNFKSDFQHSTFPPLSFWSFIQHTRTLSPLSFSCPYPYLLSLLPFSSRLPSILLPFLPFTPLF